MVKALFVLFTTFLMFSFSRAVGKVKVCNTVNGEEICDEVESEGNTAEAFASVLIVPGEIHQKTSAGIGTRGGPWKSSQHSVVNGKDVGVVAESLPNGGAVGVVAAPLPNGGAVDNFPRRRR